MAISGTRLQKVRLLQLKLGLYSMVSVIFLYNLIVLIIWYVACFSPSKSFINITCNSAYIINSTSRSSIISRKIIIKESINIYMSTSISAAVALAIVVIIVGAMVV